MFLNFRVAQATFYEMDSKYGQLKNYAKGAQNNPPSLENDKDQSQRISTRNLFQNNLGRLQNFFGRYSTGMNDGTLSGSEDLQGLLQKGDNDPILPALTRKQRILGFMMCLCMGVFLMSLATLYIPLLVLKARKFAVLFSLGSVFFLTSFSMLWGPTNHMKHLLNIDRIPFSISYATTLIGTIYFSIWVQSYLLTIVFALLQIGALVWYIVSYIPGGARGLKFFSRLFYTFISKTVTTTLTV